MLQPIILLVVLIALNAIFASAEIAVLSTSEAKLKKMASDNDKRAEKLLKLITKPAGFLATIQVAITLAGLLQSAFAAENFAEPLVEFLINKGVPIPESILTTVSILVITLILSYFTLVFGELVPKRIAMKKSEAISLKMAHMLYTFSNIFKPVVWLLSVSTNGILKIMGMNPDEQSEQVTEEEIKLMLSEGNEQGNIRSDEKEIIQNVFEFNDICVDEICTHRIETVMLHMEDSVEEWDEIIVKNRHTFYPICEEDADEIIAVLDTKDYFRSKNHDKKYLLDNASEPPFFVPSTMRANALFNEMKKLKTYFAVILDEYGGMTGIITLHDLIESLVGELSEKEDIQSVVEIKEIDSNTWEIYGSASMKEVIQTLNIEIELDDIETFGGFINSITKRIPDDGESFICNTDELTINVHEVKNHVIGLTTVTKKEENKTEE